VKINLQSIKDENFVSQISRQVHELESKTNEEEKKILSKVGF
jgi:formiminotetrahydrofolate cyclodeaminase